jgi:pilus assembly protein CpaE
VNRGVPLVLDEPKHAVSVAFRDLVEGHIRVSPVGADQGDSATRSEPRRRGDRWLLSRGGKS